MLLGTLITFDLELLANLLLFFNCELSLLGVVGVLFLLRTSRSSLSDSPPESSGGLK